MNRCMNRGARFRPAVRGRPAAGPSCVHKMHGPAKAACRRRSQIVHSTSIRRVLVPSSGGATSDKDELRSPMNGALLLAVLLGLLLLLLWFNPPPPP